MFKKVYLPLLGMLVFLSLLLTGCGCKHEWQAAACDAPKTCSKCNITEGEALGHKWTDADCENAKTCSVCKKTDGAALGHTWVYADCENAKTCSTCKKVDGEALGHQWIDATCEKASTCSACQKTKGNALGHTWADATCEAPTTCSVCKKTDGNALGHNWIPSNCESPSTCTVCGKTEGVAMGHYWTPANRTQPKTCSTCNLTEGEPLPHDEESAKKLYGAYIATVHLTSEDIGVEGFTGTLTLYHTIAFWDYGSYSYFVSIANKSRFLKDLEDHYVATFYAEFAKQGLNQTQADEAMKATYGMDVRAYSKQLANSVNWDALVNVEEYGVFYVSGNRVYIAPEWGGEFESDTFSVSYGVLTLGSMPDVRFNIVA